MFSGRSDAKAETPVLWPPHVKSWLIGKDSDAGRDWGQEEKGPTEDEMARWHHRLDGREFEWTPGVDDGQGGLACCSSWGHKESDATERLNCTEQTGWILEKILSVISKWKKVAYSQWYFFFFEARSAFYFIFHLFLKLEYNCFTVLHWFPLYYDVNQLWHTHILSLLNLPPNPHPTPLGHQRAPSWALSAVQQLPAS